MGDAILKMSREIIDLRVPEDRDFCMQKCEPYDLVSSNDDVCKSVSHISTDLIFVSELQILEPILMSS